MSWINEMFGVQKPIIAMCHLQAMPGDPYYDHAGGMKRVVELARKDVYALQEGGVEAIMFSNKYSLPYLTKVRTETVASMARVIGELMNEITMTYGVNCLWDQIASIDLAVAVDAKFIRDDHKRGLCQRFRALEYKCRGDDPSQDGSRSV